ncbi:hypothetical protein [Paractinoplanes globisporus]|uniref:Uncharacterized protein n=1 Tax=Paractinoplanes globisporus TaxID=113565 RepID=A0ABW6W7H5_9ACTN|nr:hypothetical protein [Actinoplanes globisporus]
MSQFDLGAPRDRRVTIPLARAGDPAPGNPDDVDRYTGRRHRVALVSDASGLRAGAEAATALAGMEPVAAFLNHHSGLEIALLPVDTRQAALEDTVAALTPGFAAVCLHHTSTARADAVRDRLDRLRPVLPVLETGDDSAAVTVIAALLNAVRQTHVPLSASRVLVIDAHTVPEIAALLTATGVRDLTFADSRLTVDATPGEVPVRYDVLIDLSVADSVPPQWVDDRDPPHINLTMNGRDDDTATGPARPNRLHPLLALPGLLSVSVHRRMTIDIGHRLAAAHALARLAGPGRLLPDPLDPRLTATVYAAVTALQ